MLVELHDPWFAPSEPRQRDKIQVISGIKYKKGIHEIPDELRDVLPSSAKILNEMPEEIVEKESDDLKDYDQERKAADALQAVIEVGDKAALSLKERRQGQMAKARAAKKIKRDKRASA